jgi:hypothetical protein
MIRGSLPKASCERRPFAYTAGSRVREGSQRSAGRRERGLRVAVLGRRGAARAATRRSDFGSKVTGRNFHPRVSIDRRILTNDDTTSRPRQFPKPLQPHRTATFRRASRRRTTQNRPSQTPTSTADFSTPARNRSSWPLRMRRQRSLEWRELFAISRRVTTASARLRASTYARTACCRRDRW